MVAEYQPSRVTAWSIPAIELYGRMQTPCVSLVAAVYWSLFRLFADGLQAIPDSRVHRHHSSHYTAGVASIFGTSLRFVT